MRENHNVNPTSSEIGNPPNWEARSKETENRKVGGMKKRQSGREENVLISRLCFC